VAAVTEAEARRREEAAWREGCRVGINLAVDEALERRRDEHETGAREERAWRVSATRQLQRRPRTRKGR
jgi:hypothetical protein